MEVRELKHRDGWVVIDPTFGPVAVTEDEWTANGIVHDIERMSPQRYWDEFIRL